MEHKILWLFLSCLIVLTLVAWSCSGTSPVDGEQQEEEEWGSKIKFISDRDGNWEIYVMNPDGTDQTRLTNNTDWDYAPSWSPDGKKMVFVSKRDGNDEIYIMNTDGTEQIRLTAWSDERTILPETLKLMEPGPI